MIEVTQIASDYDEAENVLDSLIQHADAAGTSLEQSSNALQEGLERELDESRESFEEFYEEARKSSSQSLELIKEYSEFLGHFDDALKKEHTQIADHRENVEQKTAEAVTEIDQAREETEANRAEIEAAIESAREILGVILDGFQSALGTAEDLMPQFLGSVGDFRDQVTTSSESANGGFSSLLDAVKGELTEIAEAAFNSLNETIEQITEEADGGVETLKGIAEDSLGQFEETYRELGERMSGHLTDALTELSTHTGDTVCTQVSDTIEQVIADAVAKLATEIAEAISLGTVGSQITAGLSPILPQLAAAKAVVGAIEKALAVLDSIF